MLTKPINLSPKIKAKLYGDDFHNISRQGIIEEVETWKNLQISVFWENLRVLKKDLSNNNSIIDFSYFVFPNFEQTQKNCNFWNEDEELTFTKEVSFANAYFVGEVNFSKTCFKHSADFSKVNFKGVVNFNNTIFEKELTFNRTQFRDEANFYHTSFQEKVVFDNVTFHTKTVFHQATFLKKGSFSPLSSKYRITFFNCVAQKISFKYSRIENAYFINNHFEYLNLHGVAIQNPFFSDNDINEAERETFAYMKNFFDKRNDYISANYYYAKEMRAYQKKLFPKSKANIFKKTYHWFNKPNLGDKLVFGFSKIASNFGQNIFLPLYWIIFMSTLFIGLKGNEAQNFMMYSIILLTLFIAISTLIQKLFKHKKREDSIWLLGQTTLSFIIIGIWIYKSQFIADFAKVINPLQLLKDPTNYCASIELSCFMLKIFIGIMVYHFIIASKRGVKR